MKPLLGIVLALSLLGCGTVAPVKVKDNNSTSDSSTPAQYAGKGWILFFSDKGDAVITDHALIRYNVLIGAYRVTFKKRYQVDLEANDGVHDFIDEYGNALHAIDPEHLEYFARLSQMAKDNHDPDGLLDRIKDKVP